jgi:hypothetical protein
MFQKILKVSLLSLVVSLLPSSFQSANSSEILWNPGVGNDLNSAGAGLVPGAGIRNTGLLVNKSNPDELIMKIIMSESFEDKPFTGKGRNMAMWIYWPKNYCWSKDTANCEGLFTVGEPFNPSSYPSAKSSEYVFVQKHEKASNVNVTATTCKAPWWIDTTYKSRDTWAFAVSITCLGIPKEFGWYAFSEISLGQKDVVADFTQVQTITYPFHELAAKAYTPVTDSQEKILAFVGFRNLVASGKKQSDSLKSLISKSKTISKAKKKTYQATAKEFDAYVKDFESRIAGIEVLPYDANVKATMVNEITQYQKVLGKLIKVLGEIVRK